MSDKIQIRLHHPSCTSLKPTESDHACDCRYEHKWVGAAPRAYLEFRNSRKWSSDA